MCSWERVGVDKNYQLNFRMVANLSMVQEQLPWDRGGGTGAVAVAPHL